MLLFLIFILAVLTIGFSIFKIGDAFSPWSITSAVWLGIFVMFSLFGYNLYPLQDRLYTCVMIWVPILVLTSIATYYALPTDNSKDISDGIEISGLPYKFLFALAIVCSPLYLYQVVKVAMMFDMNNLLNNIRIFSSYADKNALMTLLIYVNPINQVLFITEMWNYPNNGKWRLWVIVAANMFCTIAVMSKTPIFILFISSLYILYEKRSIKLSSIFFWGIFLLAVFYGFNEIRNPESARGESSFLDFFSMYVLSPSVAFEWAQEKLTDQFGSFSFAFFYAFATKLGLGTFYVQKQLQDFVDVPIPTNVYTVFQPYFEDFGYKGVAVFASLWGILTGWMYRLSKNGNVMAKCMYAYIVFALVMQFYQESLFVNLSYVLQYAIFFTLIIRHRMRFTFSNTNNGKNE